MPTFLSAFEEKFEISVDSEMRSSSARSQKLFIFTTPVVNTEARRSALPIPSSFESCSEFSTHQERRRATKAHLLYKQDPSWCRDQVFATREAYIITRQCFLQTFSVFPDVHYNCCYRTSLKSLFRKVDLSGRISRWAVELGQYDI